MKRVFSFAHFACEESKTTCSRLVLGLQIAATMASRFEIVDEEYIELKDKSENEKDRVLEELSQKGGEWKKLQENLEEYANDVLDQRLSQF